MRRTFCATVLGATLLLAASPSWSGPLDTLQPGQWYMAPNSALSAAPGVIPSPTPPGYPAAVMNAWSGGAFDTRRNRLLVWGGGHGDYAGNEIYAFDVNSFTWSRIWGPTPNALINADFGLTYLDGNPKSRHTYDGLEYLPNQDRFWIHGGSLYTGSGGAGWDTWTFDIAGGRWERKLDVPWCCSLEDLTGYDPVTGHVFLISGYDLWEFDPNTNSYTKRNSVGSIPSPTGTIDSKRRKFVAVGTDPEGAMGKVCVWDIVPPYSRTIVQTTGDTQILTHRYPGLEYDPVSDRIVAWAGGADVYTLNLDTLQWTRRTPASGNTVIPTAAASAGTYGRFRYIPSKNVFVVVNAIDQNVYFYKLGAGGGTPTDSVAPSAPANLRTR